MVVKSEQFSVFFWTWLMYNPRAGLRNPRLDEQRPATTPVCVVTLPGVEYLHQHLMAAERPPAGGEQGLPLYLMIRLGLKEPPNRATPRVADCPTACLRCETSPLPPPTNP